MYAQDFQDCGCEGFLDSRFRGNDSEAGGGMTVMIRMICVMVS